MDRSPFSYLRQLAAAMVIKGNSSAFGFPVTESVHFKSPSARGRFFWLNLHVFTDFAVNAKSWAELSPLLSISIHSALQQCYNRCRLRHLFQQFPDADQFHAKHKQPCSFLHLSQ